jgi:hypothetical protein
VDEKQIVRVVVVIHHDLLRLVPVMSLRHEADIEVVGEARNGASALSEVRRTLPDVLLLEVPMSPFGGPHPTDQLADIEAPRHAWMDLFSTKSRTVMGLAQESAAHLNHNWIGTEHILLGLIREDEGIAAKALESLGISLSKVHEQVEASEAGRGAQSPARITLAEDARNALERSLQEAKQLGEDRIDTEHILLGLFSEEGSAARMLVRLGVDPGRVRRRVIELLSGVPEATESHHWVKVLSNVKDAFPRLGVVAFLFGELIPDLAAMSLRAGASVYVSGLDPPEKVVDAVRVAANLNKPGV